MLNNRSIYSLIAHTLATIGGAWFAVVYSTKSAGIFASGNDAAEAGGGIFSILLWVIALIVFVVALAPFIGLILGWISFFMRQPVLTLIASITYLLLAVFSIGDSLGELSGALVMSLISGILGIKGFADERKIKSRS
ncbi:unannotated protein [freshwater metagenome]|uniref:Unannotated protein n=1 Tax=freshwater metagenome TaxID=449393 RepID=A0A6J7KNM1_9ZZZZ|nr:hypothetical protein [Actinomycetota bacterium]